MPLGEPTVSPTRRHLQIVRLDLLPGQTLCIYIYIRLMTALSVLDR